MAANVTDPDAGARPRWLELLKSTPERLEFTTRLALICALATLVAEIYQTPDPALTAYIAFFLNKPERAESVILSIALTVVITVVIGIVFLVAQWAADDPMWRVISITVISFVMLFLGSASKLRPLAGTMALIVGYGLDLLGLIQAGELATRALLYAWLFVGIPAGVSIVVNLLLGPSPRRAAEQAIAERLEVCATLLRDPDNTAQVQLQEFLREGVAPVLTQLKLAGVEKSAPAAAIAALRQATLSSWTIVNVVSDPKVVLSSAERASVADILDEMASILRRGGYPVGITLERPLPGILASALTQFAEPVGEMPAPEKEAGGFFVKDAFTNPEHVQYAVKTTVAAVFCYVLYSILDWPGIHTCFLTVYIVSQTTAAESVEKLSLRIIGCLVGAAAGYGAIIYLMPGVTSIGGLMIAVFVGAWGAAYVAAGSPRISYAGFQIAFAFFLCVVQGTGPGFDLTVARDRVIGILVGNLVAWLALVYVWPATVTKRIDPGFATVLEHLGKLVSTKNMNERRLLAAQAQSTLATVESDIELAGYEPPAIRAPAAWLSNRRQAAEELRVLSTRLLVEDVESQTPVASRLEALAAHLEGRPWSSDHARA
jgi:multidrug resistance protein MdtO